MLYTSIIVQLLHKLSIHAADGPVKLMKVSKSLPGPDIELLVSSPQVIKNPVTDHLPNGCRRIGTSYQAKQCVDVKQFAKNGPVVIVIGAMAHGKVKFNNMFLLSTGVLCRCLWIMWNRK